MTLHKEKSQSEPSYTLTTTDYVQRPHRMKGGKLWYEFREDLINDEKGICMAWHMKSV